MKYNWSIIGHEKQLRALEKDFESGNIAHAYLLAGPNSIGKYTVAKKMAGILQCKEDFCHSCPDCIQVEKGSHVDTIEIRDDKGSIKIDEIRKLVARVNMSRQARYKVVIIQSIERMTPEAANSLLKTLEEPPESTIFILTTNNIRLLLPTVVSRTRIIQFHSVSSVYLQDMLQKLYPDCDREKAEQISLFSLGKTGKAVHFAESPEDFAQTMKLYHDVLSFLEFENIYERFSYIDDLLTEERSIDDLLNMLIHVLRSKLLAGGEESARYLNLLSKIDEAGMLIKKNVNSRLVLENLMLSL